MYTFNTPLENIARAARKAYKQANDGEMIDMYYVIYDGTPIGRLNVTIHSNSEHDYPKTIVIKAELYSDMGRANQVTCASEKSSDIYYAIGFTCASALWRAPR